MKAVLEIPRLDGGFFVESVESRLSPMPARPRPNPKATDYQARYLGAWVRVQRLPSGALFFDHGAGRIRVSIKRED